MKASPTSSHDNPIWKFFSSVRLAVFLLIILAITSIVGTVIPQGESFQFYLEKFGPVFFRIIKTLHLYDTYHSWWYITLLVLFTINLVICIANRLPFTIRLYKRDHLAVDKERLLKMPFREEWKIKGEITKEIHDKLLRIFEDAFGKTRNRSVSGGTLYLSEKGKWSYWGLYGLHASILVIIAGALIGSIYGYKGNILLLEGDTTDHLISRQNREKIPLGFEVRCDRFVVSFYDNGAPKEFRSDLTILEAGAEKRHATIRVNQPLEYNGFTFYQSSYQGVPEITLRIVSSDGKQKIFTMPAFEKIPWPEARLSLGIMQYLPNVHGVPAVRLWIKGENRPATAVWIVKNHDKELPWNNNLYRISLVGVKEKYMTGLQVKKDPGVWIVWLGCTGLILGFVIVFWVAHKRVWLWLGKDGNKSVVILAGQTNKNRLQFEKDFESLKEKLARELGGLS